MLTDDGKHLYVSWDEYHMLIERLALKVAQRAAILETGRVVITGTPAELAEHPDVRDVYLGVGGSDATEGKSFRLYRKKRRW